MTTAVVTVVRGRHGHLTNQLAGLDLSRVRPDHHIVVSMGDPEIHTLVGDAGTVLDIGRSDGPLPLADARNLGAQTAFDAGADVVIFLDVDCIPSAETVGLYVRTVGAHSHALACGPVTYLPPLDRVDVTRLDEYTNPHAARPNPESETVSRGTNFDLFWSLSFALDFPTWNAVGGYCTEYSGYGGEDTDFAWSAEKSGVDLLWVGGAHAYHQHHRVSSPPVEHLDDIVTNSRLFMRRWGRWPMSGWLDEFERRGLIEREGEKISVCQ